jgi:hypothetical protein
MPAKGGRLEAGLNRISSRATFFIKKVVPAVWLAGLLWFAAQDVMDGVDPEGIFPGVVVPALMAGVGFVIMKKLFWQAVDAVYDGGSFLLVRNGGEEETVPLPNVINVSVGSASSPPTIALRLRNPGKFGDEITFFAAGNNFGFTMFSRNRVAEDLIARVEKARLTRA